MEIKQLKCLIETFMSGLGDNSYRYPHLRQSSVLIPLFIKGGDVRVLLTKRSPNLRTHAGIVAFPGGVKDSCDKTDIETALREADEEIGLKKQDVDVVGVLPPTYASPKTTVVPVVAIINSSFEPKVNRSEVDFVFSVSLNDFNEEPRMKLSTIHRHAINIYFFEKYVNEKLVTIWGVTAHLCMTMAAIVSGKIKVPTIFPSGSDTMDIEKGFIEFYNFVARDAVYSKL